MKNVGDLQETYKEIAIKSIAFKNFLTERDLNQNMKRRLGQMSIAHRKFHDAKMGMADLICHNSCELSWEHAFENLAKDVNTHNTNIMDIGYLSKSSGIVSIASLSSSFDSIFPDGKKLVNNLLTQFPLLYFCSRARESIYVKTGSSTH